MNGEDFRAFDQKIKALVKGKGEGETLKLKAKLDAVAVTRNFIESPQVLRAFAQCAPERILDLVRYRYR